MRYRIRGIDLDRRYKKRFNDVAVVAEITEIKYLDRLCQTADILQIGSRNMQNLELLVEVAKTKKPIILKRHFGASLRDWFGAAEPIVTGKQIGRAHV